MKDKFPIRKVIKIIEVERETFKTWVHKRYFLPSVYQAQGPGEQSLYDRYDLYAIKMFAYLLGSGFYRADASLKARAFLDYIRVHRLKDSKIIFVAFFKRRMGERIMTMKSGADITDNAHLLSGDQMAPGIRILSRRDFKKSFETLFLSFKDTRIPDKFNLHGVAFESISIVDFTNLKREVDSKIKQLS